ncbi:hypothetical protein [Nitrosospira multiformis]|uniref:hypothetical protein n=1 Tax=Nitrosospira multiformis TaxID=1231 RepID=UPI000942AA3E|nr:hypothetical protein [Nitrosospira multiformis]
MKYARAREERQSFSWGLCELETGESGEIFLRIRHLCISVVAISGTWGHAAVLELLARGQPVTAELASKVNVANSVSVGKPGSMYSQAAAARWITRRA